MLVSHRKKFIYTKTIKTGGTSVESYFEKFCMPENEWKLSEARDEYNSNDGIIGYRGPKPPDNCTFWNHMPAKALRKQLGKEIWEEYLKFCVVRNPYDKVVSAFYFMNRSKTQRTESLDLDRDRLELENWLSTKPTNLNDRNKYKINGKICIDHFIRYENLLLDIEKVCNEINIPWDESLLNKFKSGVRPKATEPKLLYTEKSKKIVEKIFDFEINYFEYSFPG